MYGVFRVAHTLVSRVDTMTMLHKIRRRLPPPLFWWNMLLISKLATICQNATLVDESARLESGEEDSPVLVDDKGMCKFQ